MNGWDFSILWQAGSAVLGGQNPYSSGYFYYPLPFAYGTAILALLPEQISFGLWIAANLFILVAVFRRSFWHWVFFLPILHMLSSGNVDLLFWVIARGLGRHWRGAVLGALITLKPQVALILLPWHLLDWLKSDRLTLGRWAVITTLLWATPLLWQPSWIAEWTEATPDLSWLTASNSPGLFSLLKVWPHLAIPLSLFAVALFAWGLWQRNEITRACALLTSPVGMFYQTMALLDCAPAVVLVPISLLAAALSLASGTFIPFALVPFAVVAWHWSRARKRPEGSVPSDPERRGTLT